MVRNNWKKPSEKQQQQQTNLCTFQSEHNFTDYCTVQY